MQKSYLQKSLSERNSESLRKGLQTEFLYAGLVQWLVCQSSKLDMRVRFSYPAQVKPKQNQNNGKKSV